VLQWWIDDDDSLRFDHTNGRLGVLALYPMLVAYVGLFVSMEQLDANRQILIY
jgi:hypothetical protein